VPSARRFVIDWRDLVHEWKIPVGGAASCDDSSSSCGMGEGPASDGEGTAGAMTF